MAEMSREELIRRLEALRPEFAKVMLQHGAHEPDWAPLEKVLLGDFMFMGYCQGIRMYKHHYTRRYLHLDAQGRAYRWISKGGRYEQIPLEEGIAHAFEDAEELMCWLRQDASSENP